MIHWLLAAASASDDVAIHPFDPQVRATVTDDGAVSVSTDGGRGWTRALGPLLGSGEEEAAGEVAARLEELGVPEPPPIEDGELDPDELAAAIEDAVEAHAAAVEEAVSEVRGELETGAWFLDPTAPTSARVWFSVEGELVVARADGLRRSPDLGARWVQTLDEPVTAWAELPGGAEVVGTPSGLLVSATGVGWIPALTGVAVTDLVLRDELRACTPEGAWAADPADLHAWHRVPRGCAGPAADPVAMVSRLDPDSLGALIEASGRRPGLAERSGRRAVSAWVPELAVEGLVSQRVGDDWNADTWTIRGVDTAWELRGVLTWTGPRPVPTVEPMVLDGEVQVDDGSASWLLASRVGRQGAAYRADLAATVSGLYRRREELASSPSPSGLVDRVRRALQVAELDARLDALTEGGGE